MCSEAVIQSTKHVRYISISWLQLYTFLLFCWCKATCKTHRGISFGRSWDDSDVVWVSYRKTWKSSGIFTYLATVGTLVLCLFDSPLIWVCTSPPPARPHDFFDAQTMDAIRHRAICLNLATHIESVGNGHSVVFNSTVSLCAASLLLLVVSCRVCRWLPVSFWMGLNIMSSCWNSETRVKGCITRCIPLLYGRLPAKVGKTNNSALSCSWCAF